MHRETFDKLLDLVRDKLERQDTRFSNYIPAEKVLATDKTYRSSAVAVDLVAVDSWPTDS